MRWEIKAIYLCLISGLITGCMTTKNPPREVVAPQNIDNPIMQISLSDKTALPASAGSVLCFNYDTGTNTISGPKGMVFSLSAPLPQSASGVAKTVEVIISLGTNTDFSVNGTRGSVTVPKPASSIIPFYVSMAGISSGQYRDIQGTGMLNVAIYDLDDSVRPRDTGKQISNCLTFPYIIHESKMGR